MSLQRLFVKTGKNPLVNELAVKVAKEAGYATGYVERQDFMNRARAFRFEQADSGFIDMEDLFYDTQAGLHYDLRTELGKFIKEILIQPITIVVEGDEKTVLFNKDGSIEVGCTTVPTATMEEIIKRRAAIMKQ